MVNSPRTCALSLSALALSVFIPVAASSQTAFSAHTLYTSSSFIDMAGHGDFNNDGRDDIILFDQANPNNPVSLLFLSNGNGTYDAPKTLAGFVSAQYTAIGDFNADGNLDYTAWNYSHSQLLIFLGHGDGTFTQCGFTIPTPNGVGNVAAGDLNHDGKTDLVVTNYNNGKKTVQVWLSNGDGTFTNSQTITSGLIDLDFGAWISDVDGDGKADLIVTNAGEKGSPTTVQVWFGDGKGHLGSPTQLTDPNGYDDRYDSTVSPVADYNNDGKADLLFYRTIYGASGTGSFLLQIAVFSGNSNRTLSFHTINTNGCPHGISVADYNGDGRNDLAYAEVPCSGISGNSPQNVVVRPATSPGVFGAEQIIYSNAYETAIDMLALKSTRGTKPDLSFVKWNGQRTNSTLPPMSLILLTNNSSGWFPGCGTTAMAEGIHVCMPSGSTATSPVQFSVSASGPTPMRKVAVWVDGKKMAEQLTHAFSNYSFLDKSLSLSAGSHKISIFGAGWDNTLQKKTFTLTVGSGGGGSCSAPSSPGVHICTPANGSTVSSPVSVSAAADVTGTIARMELWVDGVKKYTESSGATLTASIALPAGKHKFGVFAINTAGQKWNSVVYAAVGSRTTCSAPSSDGVHVCSPVNGSTVSSPVQVSATGKVSGTFSHMELWVDGATKFSESSSPTLSTKISLAAGKHKFGFFAVNTAGQKWNTVVYATVQ